MPDLIVMELGMHTVVCRDGSRQQLGEHVPTAMDTCSTTEVLLKKVFSTVVYAKGL
jgi:hypothetical protein